MKRQIQSSWTAAVEDLLLESRLVTLGDELIEGCRAEKSGRLIWAIGRRMLWSGTAEFLTRQTGMLQNLGSESQQRLHRSRVVVTGGESSETINFLTRQTPMLRYRLLQRPN